MFLSEITTVNSPFGSFWNPSNSSTFTLKNSSYNLVISLQITIFLPLKYILISGITLLIFFGDIKKTKVELNSDIFLSSFIICCFLFGKKPQKKNWSENPLIDIAVKTADGPGIGTILISFLIHSLIKTEPGSDIAGVPASEIRDIIFPDFKYSIIFRVFFFH